MTMAKDTDDKAPVTPEMIYAGSDDITDADLFGGDRGDLGDIGATAETDVSLDPAAAAAAAAELTAGDDKTPAAAKTDDKPADKVTDKAADEKATAKAPADKVAPAEEEPAGEPAEPPVGGKKEFLDRLAAKNRKIQALERQLNEANAAKPAPKTEAAPVADKPDAAAEAEITRISNEIKDLRKKALDAQLDGKVDDAIALQEQLEGKLEERILAKARLDQTKVIEQARAATRADRESETMDQVVTELVAEHPELDGDAPEYDEDLVAMINAAATRRVQKDGLTGPEALRAAAQAVFGRFKAPAAVAVEKTTAAPGKKPGLDVAATLDAASKQPAAPSASSAARTTAKLDTEVDIMTMPETDFLKLSADQLAVLRGDSL